MIQASGPANASIMIVGEFPHEGDLRKGLPFIGGAGFELTKMLSEAGINREHCYLTMVTRERVPASNILYLTVDKKKDIGPQHSLYRGRWCTQQLIDGVTSLREEILRVKPNIVITLGNLALWALTGEWSANAWRSSVMESTLVAGVKVVPTLSPGIVHVQWSQRTLLVHDFKRAKRNSDTPVLIDRNYKFLILTNNFNVEF